MSVHVLMHLPPPLLGEPARHSVEAHGEKCGCCAAKDVEMDKINGCALLDPVM